MHQPDLFDAGPRTAPAAKNKRHKKTCTAAPIGTGPKGETCQTCQHFYRIKASSKYYLKCGLMRQHWTHGPGSDILARWAACRQWEPIDLNATPGDSQT